MNAKQRKLIYRILPYAILTGIGICFFARWVLVASVDPNAMQSLKMPKGYQCKLCRGDDQRREPACISDWSGDVAWPSRIGSSGRSRLSAIPVSDEI